MISQGVALTAKQSRFCSKCAENKAKTPDFVRKIGCLLFSNCISLFKLWASLDGRNIHIDVQFKAKRTLVIQIWYVIAKIKIKRAGYESFQ